MITRLLRVVGRAVRPFLRRLGYDIVPFNPIFLPSLQRARILQRNQISLVLDVGAATGLYVQELRNTGYTGRIVSFEPLPQSFAQLNQKAMNDPKWACKQAGLGDTPGELTINVFGAPDMSSFLPLAEDQVGRYETWHFEHQETVPVMRLDDCVAEWVQPGDRIHLKLDVQGFEMKVLAGATAVLPQVESVEVELSFEPVYAGQPLMCDVINFLHEAGFSQVSANRIYRDPDTGYEFQIDGIFVRR